MADNQQSVPMRSSRNSRWKRGFPCNNKAFLSKISGVLSCLCLLQLRPDLNKKPSCR